MALFTYAVTVRGGSLVEPSEFSVDASSIDRAVQSALFLMQSQAPYSPTPYELLVSRGPVERHVQWRAHAH